MQNVRVFFSKTGDARFISHLDLMRCMTRAISRAGIPIAYTEGFNPRPYMNFAMSLSLGFEGLREAVDFRIDDSMSIDDMVLKLREVMPPDIKILEAITPTHKVSDVGFSKYKVEIKQSEISANDLDKRIVDALSASEYTVSKVGKQGRNKVVKQINFTEHVQSLKTWTLDDNINVITMTLPSNPQFGLSPKQFTNRFFEDLGIEPEYIHITRKCLLCSDGSEFC